MSEGGWIAPSQPFLCPNFCVNNWLPTIEPHNLLAVATFVPLTGIRNTDRLACYADAMELRHLRYFCAVAEEGNFSLAAKRLNVSQSGVSGQVRDLEKEIGVTLLRRGAREVTLTPQGVIFFEEAKGIILRAEHAVELVLKSSRGEVGKLSVGLCGPVTSTILPEIIRKFRERFPEIELVSKERTSAEQVTCFIDGLIDIAFTRGVPPEVRHLVHHETLRKEPVVVVMHKSHKLCVEKTISVTSLSSERLVLYCREGAPELFDNIIATFKKAKFSPQIADMPVSWLSILTMVESGEGIGLVPACVRHLSNSKNLVFRPLAQNRCMVDALYAWRRNDQNAVVAEFLELIRLKRSELTD